MLISPVGLWSTGSAPKAHCDNFPVRSNKLFRKGDTAPVPANDLDRGSVNLTKIRNYHIFRNTIANLFFDAWPTSLRCFLTVFHFLAVSTLCSITSAQAHEVFKLLQGTGTINPEPPLPTVNSTPAYEDDHNWIFSTLDQKYYLIPKRLTLFKSAAPFLFGASVQSKQQNHLIIILIHGADKSSITKSIKEFTKLNPSVAVNIYPASISNISFITDPLDHVVLKYNTITSSSNLISSNFMTLSVIQSAGRSNVRQTKSLLSNGISAVAYLKIKSLTAVGKSTETLLTIPLQLNSINVTSNGL